MMVLSNMFIDAWTHAELCKRCAVTLDGHDIKGSYNDIRHAINVIANDKETKNYLWEELREET